MRTPSDMPPRAPRPRRNRPRRRWFAGRGRVIVIGILVVLVVLFVSARTLAGYYVDFLWYRSLGQSSTYWTMFWAKVSLLLIFAVGFAVVAAVNFVVADRIAPLYVPDPAGLAFVDRYRELVGARQRWVRIGAAAILGLMLGVPTMSEWQGWLLFRNYQSFGTADPQFDTDVGFYVFRLPFLSYVMTWGFAAIAVLGLAVAATYVANGSLRFQMHGVHLSRGARVHLSILGALLALVKAGDYWLQRYSLTTSTRGAVHGATYTDVNAQLPAINLLILVCLLVAALFLVSLRRGGWRLPVAAAALWLVVAVVAGAVYPAVVQRFVVQPNVANRERPYIQRNIDATRAAMGIADVDVQTIEVGAVTPSDVAGDTAPLQDARLLNPSQMEDRFSLDQRQSSFYAVNDLDPDRYADETGQVRQVLVAARELNPDGIPNKTWVSRHLTYTHGCGLVQASASQVDPEGSPVYEQVPLDRPELYVGEGLGDYAITNSENAEHSCGAEPVEYTGTNGVELGSAVTRLAFAVHFGEYNLFGSSLITGDSQIIYVRDVRDRVEKVAPFLSVDGDPYPVAVDGRVVWVLDAFTTTNRYPYAQRANTSQLSDGSGLDHSFNYVRNSVKAVVDAYTGQVTLYVVDDTDPIVKAWQSAFPDLFTPGSEVPAELRAHFRYPEDLFRVQTNVYGRYQLDDPTQFFNSDLRWSVAQNPPSRPLEATTQAATTGSTATTEALREADTGNVSDPDTERFVPYYTMFDEPDGTRTFSMLRPFVPFSSNDSVRDLAGYMTVSSDPESYGQLTLYRVSGSLPPGPALAAATIDSNAAIASEITLLSNTGSTVTFGNLQLVPIREGIVWVRPVYLQPAGTGEGQVYLRQVIVAYANRAVMAPSLTEAVNELFAGANVQLGDVVGGETITPPEGEPPTDQSAADLLAQAEQLYQQADQALADSDLGEYARLTDEARQLVTEALDKLDPTAVTTTVPGEGTSDGSSSDGSSSDGSSQDGSSAGTSSPDAATTTTASGS